MTTTASRVLVVDDEPSIRASVRICLEEAGYAVDQASDGADALERIQRNAPDLVLLDLAMPVMDGMSVLAEARKLLNPSSTRFIVVTAHGSMRSAVDAMRLGAIDFLTKPFTPTQLRHSVAAGLRDEPNAAKTPMPDPEALEFGELDTDAGYRAALAAVRRRLAADDMESARAALAKISTAVPARANADPSFLNLAGVTYEVEGRLVSARSFYTKAIMIAGAGRYAPAGDNKWRVYDRIGGMRSDIDVVLGDARELIEAFPAGVPKSPLAHLKEPNLPEKWDQ